MKGIVAVLALLVASCSWSALPSARSTSTTSSPRPSQDAASSPTSGSAQIPTALKWTELQGIAAGGPAVESANSSLWIATAQNQLVEYGASGSLSATALPVQPFDQPRGIAIGSDRSVWVSEDDSVVHIGPDHHIDNVFNIQGQPNGRVAVGLDQAVWVTELGRDRVARISPSGQVTEFPLPAAPPIQCGGRCPYGVVAGPDGNIWITESQLAAGDLVGRMTPTGQYQDWPLPEAGASLDDITVGPDGALWFGEDRAPRLGRVTTDGQITEMPVTMPNHGGGTEMVTSGEGLVWFSVATAPSYAEEPIVVGVAAPNATPQLYTIPGSVGPVAAIVPVSSRHATAVDVVTGGGQIWQGISS